MAKRLHKLIWNNQKANNMRKLFLLGILVYGISCTNPENSVNNHTDSAKNANTEDHTLNAASPNIDRNPSTTGLDSSNNPTTGAKGSANERSDAAGDSNASKRH